MTSHDAEREERGGRARQSLLRQIREQGIKAPDAETLREMGRVWPEDEDPDDFLRARERWRREALPPEEKENVMEIATSWFEDGLKQGLEKGQLKAARDDVVETLEARFKRIPAGVKRTLRTIDDRKRLRLLLRQAATVASLKEFERRLAEAS